ncbi:CusA/CzcA family heavy metal efflux RND transporter [uncultured Spirosoma sp.]|uniref:efflux RND transporter permease subunit n=1 Tax=uncultured Spirosoma sp. TaxID=278208 RepID=UPI0025855918|nr:CusA/CzcA family heavy metal efflux RND transporter [uncultured Spirosoma sp.]
MNKLIQLAIERRWLMVALFLMTGFFGYYSFQQLAIEAYPDIADVTSQVITQVPGLAAEEIEERITIPLERELNGIPGLSIMRSKSTFGLSIITMVFKDGVDDYWARQRIQERIANVDLPEGANPGLDPLTSPIGEIYRFTLQSKTRDIRALKELQQWIVTPELKKVFGVADVTNFGGITTQFQVEVDPNKLDQYGISLDELEQTIQRNNNNAGGSVLVRGSLGYVVRGIGLVRSLADLGNIVITEKNGVPIFLKDMGTVNYGSIQRSGLVAINDKSDVVSGIVLLLKHQNPSQVLDCIHQAVDRLNGGLLPADVKLVPYLDRTSLVDTTLHTVSKTLLEGMGLVVLVLILFLGSWRGALLVAITVPLSLLVAFIMMYVTNIPANLLSLGAIDFGILVDGAIVMMESILKYREDNEHQTLNERSIADVAASVARPILFATLIIVTAYIPLFSFERVERKLFTPMAFTVGYALFGALLVALLLIPGLSYSAYRKPRKLFHNRWLERLTAGYERIISRIMVQPKRVFAPLAGILVVVGVLTYTVGKDFLPYLDEGSIWVQVTLPPGLSLAKSQQMAKQLIQETRKSPEVTYMMIQVGRNDDGTDPWTPSHFECSVGLKPYREWPSGKTKQDLIAELDARYKKLPGYVVGFSQPMIDGVMDKIAGAHSELVVKIFGHDFKETRRIAEDVERTLKATPGAVDVSIDQEPPLPQLQVNIDRDRVARYGLNVSDVNELLSTAIGGRPVSTLFIGERRYDITVRYAPEFRASPDAIGNLLLTAPNGARIPISQVADIRLETGESTITREMAKRHLTVKLNLRGRDLSSFLTDAQARIDQQVHYDRNQYGINWGGQFENQQRAYARLGIIVPLALAIMFVLLFGAFGRFDQAGLVLSVIPLAALGGVLALNIRGMTLNVSSAVGFIALFGVAIQNGVIMISHLNEVVHTSGLPLKSAVIKAARDRFRPVLMTATVATLGLLPASLSTGIGSDVQRPLATVIVYGLSTATLLTLFALPALYYLLENRYGHPKTTPADV